MSKHITTREQDEKAKLIEHMLSEVESHLYEEKRPSEFIESLRNWFDNTGELTEKQFAALEKFYERI